MKITNVVGQSAVSCGFSHHLLTARGGAYRARRLIALVDTVRRIGKTPPVAFGDFNELES